MSHPHAELMKQYAEDAAKYDEPWKLWEYKRNKGWGTFKNNPTWDPAGSYRRKIEKPIKINGFDVPEPLRSVPAVGTKYYLTCLDEAIDPNSPYIWEDDPSTDVRWLLEGRIHLTQEAANLHRKALLSFTAAE